MERSRKKGETAKRGRRKTRRGKEREGKREKKKKLWEDGDGQIEGEEMHLRGEKGERKR